MKPSHILVVTGARALDVHGPSRAWARRVVARAMTTPDRVGDVSLVAHGDAKGPDTWADYLALWLHLPRVGWPLVAPGAPVVWHGAGARAARDAERYRYDWRDPLARNEAMVRWASDLALEGHIVRVLALTAGWSGTGGTRHTMARARHHGLCIEHHDAPDWTWPECDERDASGTAGGGR